MKVLILSALLQIFSLSLFAGGSAHIVVQPNCNSGTDGNHDCINLVIGSGTLISNPQPLKIPKKFECPEALSLKAVTESDVELNFTALVRQAKANFRGIHSCEYAVAIVDSGLTGLSFAKLLTFPLNQSLFAEFRIEGKTSFLAISALNEAGDRTGLLAVDGENIYIAKEHLYLTKVSLSVSPKLKSVKVVKE